MATPFFPVDFNVLPSQLEFRRITTDPVAFGGLTVQGFPLHHPQGAQGYRIANGRKSIVFAIDHEHGDISIDTDLRKIARNADVLIYDAQYTPTEYTQRKGWGHGTWQEAVNVARDAQVDKLVLFHHDPDHDDAALDAIVADAQRQFPHTIAARETTTV
jgi:ribonuclease BN (tRNA processing enzyme)